MRITGVLCIKKAISDDLVGLPGEIFVLVTSRVSPLRGMRGESPAIILAACYLSQSKSCRAVRSN